MLISEYNPEEIVKFVKQNFTYISWIEDLRGDKTLCLTGSIGCVILKVLIKNSFKTLKSHPLEVSMWIEEDIKTYFIDDEKEINWTLDDLKSFMLSTIESIKDRNEQNLVYLNNALTEHKEK